MNKPFNPSPLKSNLPNTQLKQRYLAISLPRLASDRIARKRWGISWRLSARPDGEPFVIVDQIRNAWRITHLEERAEHAGLSIGLSVADARAIYPPLEIVYEAHEKDALLLHAIADWCDRYTPLVALDAPDGLILDVSGCAHLFGGEKALGVDLLTRLFQQGFCAYGAIASTPGAAWAASRFISPGPRLSEPLDPPNNEPSGEIPCEIAVIAPGKEEEALAILPLAGLRLDSETLGGLAKMGLRSIGQIMARPRAPLVRRFGKLLMLRLDQALGAVSEAISPRLPVPELSVERKLVEPIARIEDVEFLISKLADGLCNRLKKRNLGARSINLALFRVDGKVERLGVGSATALQNAENISRLFKERLTSIGEEFDAGFGFDIARLSVPETQEIRPDQASMIASTNTNTNIGTTDAHNNGNSDQDFTHLIDRLGARLGAHRVTRTVVNQTHLPERAQTHIAHATVTGSVVNNAKENEFFIHPVRPIRLLHPPEPVEAIAAVPEGPPVKFRWRRKLHDVVHVEGPERIADEWWNQKNPRHTRDYFRVEDSSGHRYWLYRQGLYASETNSPTWYMHGFFA